MAEIHLVPLGQPYQLLHSSKWAMNVGIVSGTLEDIQATVYGKSAEHAFQRAVKFVRLLTVGKVVLSDVDNSQR